MHCKIGAVWDLPTVTGMGVIDFRDLLGSAGPAGVTITPSDLQATTAHPDPESIARTKPPLSSVVLSGGARVVELALIVALSLAARETQAHSISTLDLIASVVIAALAVSMLQFCRAYKLATLKSVGKTATRLLIAWSLSLFLVDGAVKLVKIDSPDVSAWLTTLYLFGIGALLPCRFAFL